MSKSNNSSNKIYLDYAASVLVNPSSIHSAGKEAKNKLQIARREVSSILGARPEEIIFTSGGTESNNLAIQGVFFGCWTPEFKMSNTRLPHIITTNIEHPSVLETFELLAKRKLAEITIVPVETNGIVDPRKIKKEIKKNTVLVSVMYANNEIGTIQPIKEIAKEIRYWKKKGKGEVLETWERDGASTRNFSAEKYPCSKTSPFPFFHTDAVQAVNYLDLNVEKLGVDLLSLSGSKIEGAGRVGVLYKKKTVKLAKVFGGGDQEGGVRPGTENLPEILKFSFALKNVQKIKEKESKRLIKLRDYFIKELQNKNPKFSRVLGLGPDQLENFDFNFVINGDLKNRLPNNVNVTFPNIPSDLLVIELSAKGIMASAKSACKSGQGGGSDVIKAIRQAQYQGEPLVNNTKGSPWYDVGGVRFSMGRDTTKKDIIYTVKVLSKILTKLKRWYN